MTAADHPFLDRESTPSHSWERAGAGILLVGLPALATYPLVEPHEWWIPGVITIASGIPLVASLHHALQRQSQLVLSDHLLALDGAYIVYFIIGALLIPFGPRAQADYALSYYWMDAPLATRVTAVNCIGLGLALVAGSVVGRRKVAGFARTAIRLGQSLPPSWVVMAFLLAGGVSSVYVFAFDSGQRPDELAPGIIRLTSFLLLVVVVISAAQGGWWFGLLGVLVTIAQALLGLVLLSKAGVLMPLMALMAGLAWRLGVRRVVIPGLVILLGVFVLIAGPITAARNVYGISVYGDNDWIQVDVGDRLSILPKAVSRASDVIIEGDYSTWVRFCYLPPQAAGLDFYDQGNGSEDARLLGWALLPRFLFPDKPVMTRGAGELNTKITGGVGSNTGQGVFIDGYYNWGWTGVIVASVAVGCFLSWTSVFAAEVIRARALLWFPVALIGSYMAFRIDGSFLTDYWGMFILFAYAVFAGIGLEKLLSNARHAR